MTNRLMSAILISRYYFLKGMFTTMKKTVIQNETRKLTLGALFICLGVLFPYLMGHAFGVPGTILLPMHIPVIIAGLLLGPKLGLVIGILTPIASSLLTGMPPLWPMLPQMVVELGVFGVFAGFLRRKLDLPLYVSLVGAMLVGRIARGIIFAVIMLPTTAGFVMESMITTTIMGLPGIMIQLLFIPVTVKLLEKHLKLPTTKKSNNNEQSTLELKLNEAIREITAKKNTFVLIKQDEIIYRTSGKGVRPFLVLLATEEGRDLLQGAMVVDKIIGKAAAMLAVLGKTSSVYGVTMSESGKSFLEKHDKLQGFTRCVDVISKRDGQGICPIERSVLEIEDPAEAYEKVKMAVAELMKKAE